MLRPMEIALGGLVRLAALIGVAALLALMLLVVVTVTFRAIGIAFPGTYVLSEILLIPTVALSLAYAAWGNGHTRVELLTQHMPRRVAGAVQGLMLIAGSVFWVFVAWAGVKAAIRHARQGEVTPLLDIPVTPFRWLFVAAIILLISVLVLRGAQAIAGKEPRT